MNFLIDNRLPQKFACALNALDGGHEVFHLVDRFPPDEPDTSWLRALGEERGWAAVTRDNAIRRRPHERAAWAESGLPVFFLAKSWGTMPFWDQAWKLVKWWPKIAAAAARWRMGQGGLLIPVRGARLEPVTY